MKFSILCLLVDVCTKNQIVLIVETIVLYAFFHKNHLHFQIQCERSIQRNFNQNDGFSRSNAMFNVHIVNGWLVHLSSVISYKIYSVKNWIAHKSQSSCVYLNNFLYISIVLIFKIISLGSSQLFCNENSIWCHFLYKSGCKNGSITISNVCHTILVSILHILKAKTCNCHIKAIVEKTPCCLFV